MKVPSEPQSVPLPVTRRLGGRRVLRAEDAPRDALVEPRDVFRMSVWFGLTVGLAELALNFALKPLTDSSPGLFRMNRNIVWAIPTVDLILFGALGSVLSLIPRFRPRWGVRPVVAPLVALGMLVLFLTIRPLHFFGCVLLAAALSYRLSRRIERHFNAFRKWTRRTLVWMALPALGLIGVSFLAPVVRERWEMGLLAPVSFRGESAPNVLLIVLDTVRADRLSVYGYPRETTPNLSRLARQGVTFTQARSTAPWTLPSHASMMTGRWPHELSASLDGPLDETHTTLAQFLSEKGYATAGFVANTMYCSAETGLDRGFVHYEDHDISLPSLLGCTSIGRRLFGTFSEDPHRKHAERIRGDALRWIDAQGDRPFFAFLNLYDAHNPYLPPRSFDRHFGLKAETAADFETLDRWFILDKKNLSPRASQLASDCYDDCIAYLDEQVGLFLNDLERAGRLSNTLTIITADHGEHFGEHQLFGHASSLYDQEIHVPLIVIPPGGSPEPRIEGRSVSLRDLPATVVEVCGLESPFPGRSLVTPSGAPASDLAADALSEVDAPVQSSPNQGRSPVFRGPMKAIVSGHEAYVRNGDGKEELFDLESDPMETRDLAGLPESRASLDRLRAALSKRLAEGSGDAPTRATD